MDCSPLSEKIPTSQTELINVLLGNRHIESEQQQQAFFHPRSPLEFTTKEVGIDPAQVVIALKRLHQAKEKKEHVVVFGDYDADGICATTLMWQALLAYGITAHPFIPHRKHGYGLTEQSLDELFAQITPDLIVTVDNGIVAHAALRHLQEKGIDVIVTDHHQLELSGEKDEGKSQDASKAVHSLEHQQHLLQATAIIHTTALCGTTIAWILAKELLAKTEDVVHAKLQSWLDLCAIATIADQVPLLNFNRSFVVHGLPQLRVSKRIGLQVLCQQASVEQALLTTGDINYVIAPRLNALGRIAHNLDAVRLLCTKNITRAKHLVQLVDQANVTRQEMMAAQLKHALQEVQTLEQEKILIIASPAFHEGVIGLIASKLTETFHKPSIVIAVGKEVAKASARSIPGVHITNLIREVRSELIDVGGHPLAAGFSVRTENIEVMKSKLFVVAREKIQEKLLLPIREVECELSAEMVVEETVETIARFAPFGSANKEPVFLMKNVKISGAKTIGKEGKHLKAVVELADGKRVSAVGWGMGGEKNSFNDPTQLFKLVAKCTMNNFNSVANLQLEILNIEIVHSQHLSN